MRALTAVVALALLSTTASVARAADVEGATIHWTSSGSGAQAIIFVHGWTCDESSWREQVPVVSKNHRVITLDLPGHGRSGMPKAFTMELFARAVEAVRLEAKVDKVFLVGHSMGTPVIRKYALMYPDHVQGLVMVDGLVQLPGQPSPGLLPAAILTSPDVMVKGMNLFGPLTTPELQQHILKMLKGASEATAVGAFAATWDQSQWSNQKITVPVLAVFAGTRPVATQQAVKTLYPEAGYYTIPETAHFLMMEKPIEFNRLLLKFVEQFK